MAFDIDARNDAIGRDTDPKALQENAIRGLDALDLASSTPPQAHALWRSAWPKLAALALALSLWQLIAISGWRPSYVLPGPAPVFVELADRVATGEFWKAVGVTMTRGIVGFAIAVAPRPGPTPTFWGRAAARQSPPWWSAKPATRCWSTYPATTPPRPCATACWRPSRPCRSTCVSRSPGTRDLSCQSIVRSPWPPRWTSTSVTPTHPGSEDPTRTRTGCCASIFQRAQTCPCTQPSA